MKSNSKTKIAITLSLLCLANSVSAETLWSDNSISYLKNVDDFQVLENDDVDVITFEHASGHNWGDVFFFVDRITASKDSNNGKYEETYGEASARLSLSYVTGNKLAIGPIKDLFIAGTYEHDTGNSDGFGFGFNNQLLGFGAAWDVKGFNYLDSNVYYANNDDTDNDYQLTVAWGYPIAIGDHDVMVDGFFDWSSAADDHKADFHFNPQVRLDVGKYFGKAKFFEVGIEYSYWHNKFGINGIDNENTVSAIVKVHL
jgi:nucleoside-specific outer membrane channel protein Tsx